MDNFKNKFLQAGAEIGQAPVKLELNYIRPVITDVGYLPPHGSKGGWSVVQHGIGLYHASLILSRLLTEVEAEAELSNMLASSTFIRVFEPL